MLFASLGTFIILKAINAFAPLRVSEEDETVGFDLSKHGESAYND